MLILGLRSPRKRSLLNVNEHFEGKRNDKVALLYNFYIASKLQIHSMAGLTIYAIANKLVDLKDIKL